MTTPAPVALQLYTLREALADDFIGVIKKVAAIGYVGVEPFSVSGTTVEASASLFRDLGLTVCAVHSALPLGETKNEALDTMAALDCQRLISPHPGIREFETLDQVKEVCDRFNEANAVARGNGLSFGIHNHWMEFEKTEGQYVYQTMLERLDPTIFFEVDTYWVQTAGVDAVTVVEELGERAPLLHLKDGPCLQGKPMTALGEGKMNIPALVQAGEATTEWLIVELDSCAGDMMTAVKKSYTYLISQELARGNKT